MWLHIYTGSPSNSWHHRPGRPVFVGESCTISGITIVECHECWPNKRHVTVEQKLGSKDTTHLRYIICLVVQSFFGGQYFWDASSKTQMTNKSLQPWTHWLQWFLMDFHNMAALQLKHSQNLHTHHMGVSKKGVPQNGWFIMENPIKMGWFGGKTHY